MALVTHGKMREQPKVWSCEDQLKALMTLPVGFALSARKRHEAGRVHFREGDNTKKEVKVSVRINL